MTGPRPIMQSPSQPMAPAAPYRPMGCICPPTSEKTCENPMCARKGFKISAGLALTNGDRQ